MRTINWLQYRQLFHVLKTHGFREVPNRKARVFFHDATGAELILAPVADDDAVVSYHYGAAQMEVVDYGIMTRESFDLALLSAAHKTPAEAVAAPTMG